MSKFWAFVASSTFVSSLEASTVRGSVYDDYDRVAQVLQTECGDDVANLFARPTVTRSNGVSTNSVSWYTGRRGNIKPWTDLDFDTQKRVGDELGALLNRLRPMLDHAEIGESLQRWLNLPALEGNVFVIGNQPVIINWGQITDNAIDKPTGRDDLFQEVLGQFADWASAPPFGPTDQLAFPADAAGSSLQQAGESLTDTAVKDVASRATSEGIASSVATQMPCSGVIAATGVAGAIFAVLLVPGVLEYDRAPTLAISQEASADAADILRQRIADLQTILNEGACIVALPESTGPTTTNASTPQAVRYRPDSTVAPTGNADAPTSVAPLPSTIDPPASDEAQQEALSATNLVDFLDQASALVVVEGQGGYATGSGFFVNPTDLITNRHVIENAPSSTIYVASKAFDRPLEAKVIAVSENSDAGQTDMAVLRIERPAPGPFLKLATDVPRGSNVLAFGFPSIVLESDAQFQCLMSGGLETAGVDCMPYGSVSTGITTALQQGENGQTLILHSAAISEGNSGGPLVDYCGRAIGVNTFGRRDVERLQQVNFAQHAKSIDGFLTAHSIQHEIEETGCTLIPASIATASAAPTVSNPTPSGQAPAPQ